MPDVSLPEDNRAATPEESRSAVAVARPREVVALFADPLTLEAAVEALLTAGFDHADLSLLAGERVVSERLGHRIADSLVAADDPAAPRRSWVEPESRMEGRGALAAVLGYLGAVTALGLTFATGGGAAAAIAAAAVSGSAAAGLGVGLGRLFDQRLARHFHLQLLQGGILLWVRVRDAAAEAAAMAILEAHHGHHIHGAGGENPGSV